jgi:hypothetical protein
MAASLLTTPNPNAKPRAHYMACAQIALRQQSVTVHTSLGDLKIELACGQAPKLCEVRPVGFEKCANGGHGYWERQAW